MQLNDKSNRYDHISHAWVMYVKFPVENIRFGDRQGEMLRRSTAAVSSSTGFALQAPGQTSQDERRYRHAWVWITTFYYWGATAQQIVGQQQVPGVTKDDINAWALASKNSMLNNKFATKLVPLAVEAICSSEFAALSDNDLNTYAGRRTVYDVILNHKGTMGYLYHHVSHCINISWALCELPGSAAAEEIEYQTRFKMFLLGKLQISP